MGKFKIGDKVKRTGLPHRNVPVGEMYTVKSVSNTYEIELEEMNDDYWYESDHFENVAASFPIHKGDYIKSREFTREECERFCELAVESGHHRGEWMRYYEINSGKLDWLLSVSKYGELLWDTLGKNNITIKFREFLDKEKL